MRRELFGSYPGLLLKRAFITAYSYSKPKLSSYTVPRFLAIHNTVDVIVFEYLVFALSYFKLVRSDVRNED